MGKRLWGYVGNEPFLGENLPSKKGRTTELWFAKFIYEDEHGVHVALENPPYVAFQSIPSNKALSTTDVAKACGCSPRTVVRHVAYGWLKIHRQVGKEFLFLKKEIVRWMKTTEIKKGRPKKDGK